jgi:Fur family ferric uptake transcriptional regulator
MRRNLKKHNPIKGHLSTSQRRLLLELLVEAEGHIDAKELYRRASAKDDTISPATVYRSLNLFKELGLIEERRLGMVRCYYEMKQSPEHQHMICQGCGRVMEFKTPLVQELVDTIQREHDFKVTKAELCLEGYCEKCR